MQTDKTCRNCGNDDPDYMASDRHRGYYECDYCGESITVDLYA